MRRHGEVSHRHHLRLSGYEARPEADHFRLPRQAPSRKDQTTYSGWATGRSNGPTVAPTALASLAFASFFARIASISASAAATPDFGLAARPRFGWAIPTGANSIAAGRLFSTNSGAFLRWAPTPAATKASRTGLVSPAQPTRVATRAAQSMHRSTAHLAVVAS